MKTLLTTALLFVTTLTFAQTKPLYHAGDTVKVKDRYTGHRTYIIVTEAYFRSHSKQVLYDCKDSTGRLFYRLPEKSIVKLKK